MFVLISAALVAVSYAAIYYLGNYAARAEVTTVQPVKSPTRLEQTKELINQLAEQRKKDATFIAETKKQEEALKKEREAQARIDALMIVKTQLEVEISTLEKN